MPHDKPYRLLHSLARHCALATGFGLAFSGALLSTDFGGIGSMVAAEREPALALIVLAGGALSLLPVGFLTCLSDLPEPHS